MLHRLNSPSKHSRTLNVYLPNIHFHTSISSHLLQPKSHAALPAYFEPSPLSLHRLCIYAWCIYISCNTYLLRFTAPSFHRSKQVRQPKRQQSMPFIVIRSLPLTCRAKQLGDLGLTVLQSRIGLNINRGFTSQTTRYWFDKNVVCICRYPQPSFGCFGFPRCLCCPVDIWYKLSYGPITTTLLHIRWRYRSLVSVYRYILVKNC